MMAGDDRSRLLNIFGCAVLLVTSSVLMPGSDAGPNPALRDMPSVESISIPDCINISQPIEIDIQSKANNVQEVSCFKLSPNFQTCLKRRFLESDYQVLENNSLVELLTGRLHPLGEYYITPEKMALACTKGRTCNYLTLQQNEYQVHENGSLWIEPLNQILPNAKFTFELSTRTANVCYPLTQAFISCPKWAMEHNEYTIMANKSLYVIPQERYYAPGDYFMQKSGQAIACIGSLGEAPPPFIPILHAVLSAISVICLAVTIVIHVILPDLSSQRAPLLCHAFSLMMTYICLTTFKFGVQHDTAGCYTIFYIAYFFSLGSFCWLAVMAFDLWRISATLRKGTTGYSWVTSFRHPKMILYSIFGWGIPLIFIITVAITDNHTHVQNLLALYPRIQQACWFNERASMLAFLIGPMCFLLIANFLFFALSVYSIYKASRNDAEFTNMKLNKQILVICFVVFLAMGLFWMMEVIQVTSSTMHPLDWLVPDIINSSQGIIIAAVYTCRPLTLRRLREKFGHRDVEKS